ncbi:hypothetical protein B0H11DRAFT_2251723 [Mycena galericulata]|nr:hypothetical protein B0H11DRAFT_2251723 [Mycena galericulata]
MDWVSLSLLLGINTSFRIKRYGAQWLDSYAADFALKDDDYDGMPALEPNDGRSPSGQCCHLCRFCYPITKSKL